MWWQGIQSTDSELLEPFRSYSAESPGVVLATDILFIRTGVLKMKGAIQHLHEIRNSSGSLQENDRDAFTSIVNYGILIL